MPPHQDMPLEMEEFVNNLPICAASKASLLNRILEYGHCRFSDGFVTGAAEFAEWEEMEKEW